ncbi:heme-binding domain-containing protein, partial [Mesonia mobilis]
VEEVPVKVASILKTSCYDCHSNNTNYPWYQNITPVNYYLAEHINDGKKHLNFSEWENLSTSKKHHALKEILEEIEAKKMPLKSYLLLHQQAKLSATDIQTLKNWIDKNLN